MRRTRRVLRAALVLGLALQLMTFGCVNSIRSKDVLGLFNAGGGEVPIFRSVKDEVANLTRQALPDAYFSRGCVTHFLSPEAAAPHLMRALHCASGAVNPEAEDLCFHTLFEGLALPPTPPPADRTAQAWARELDVTRLEVNLKQAVRAIVRYYETSQLRRMPQSDLGVLAGLKEGLSAFRAYQGSRAVLRERSHFTSTLVMAGGAANGAYSAGMTWWLLARLDACKSAAEARVAAACPTQDAACVGRARLEPKNACLLDHVDMVAGASTGSLITVLVKDYFHPENRRRRALDKLVESYTCRTNSELYCVTDKGLGDLGLNEKGDAKGLVRFSGIARELDAYLNAGTLQSPTEYFASTVDFTTGRTFHLSSADPKDIKDVVELKQAVLASIVEPLLSEPVSSVGPLKGVLIDGGVRSGLPILTPLMRGAERAVVFVNSPLEPRPLARDPQNAVQIGLRTLDLFTHQPIVGELSEAESRLSVKRTLEYERCVERLTDEDAHPAPVPSQCSYSELSAEAFAPRPVDPALPAPDRRTVHVKLAPTEEIQQLCSGATWPSDRQAEGKEAVQQEPSVLPSAVARSFRSSWLFQPHDLPPSLQGPEAIEQIDRAKLAAVGYQFDPQAMWQMFVFGAAVAQLRCQEVSATLGWHLGAWCGSPLELKAALAPLRKHAQDQCWDKDVAKQVLCEDEDVIAFHP